MADPTRAQFEEAARQVSKTAPAGLSREQFFELVDQQLHPTFKMTGEDGPAVTSGPRPIDQNEPTTWLGGAAASLKKSILDSTINNPMLQGAAHPKTLGDVLSLVLPSGAPSIRPNSPSATGSGLAALATEAPERYGQAMKAAGAETKGVGGLATFPFRAIGKYKAGEPITVPGFERYGGKGVTVEPGPPAPAAMPLDRGVGQFVGKGVTVEPGGPAPAAMPLERGVGQFTGAGVTTAPGEAAPSAMPLESGVERYGGQSRESSPDTGPTEDQLTLSQLIESMRNPGATTPPVTPSSLGESPSVPPPTEQVSGGSAPADTAPPQAAGTRPPQQPINELVKPSKSSAGAGSDGLTDADRAAAGINPAMRITKAPQGTADLINSARGVRRQNYIKGAEEESVRQSSIARDPQEPVDMTQEKLQELLKLMRGGQ